MPLIPKSVANRRAMERLISVLRLELGNEVAILNDTGNQIHVPNPQAFHMLATEEDISKILQGWGSGCFVYPSGPTVSQDMRTGNGNVRGSLDVSSYRIVILFKSPAGYSDVVFEGINLARTEVISRMADILRGGVIEVLYKHSVNQTHIHEIKVTSDLSDIVILNNSDLTGRAVIEVEILQDVSLPMSSFSIA